MRNNLLLILPDLQDTSSCVTMLQHTYNVFTARDRDDVYRIMAHVSIQLIIMSVDNPELDGCQLCRQLKMSPACSHIPVILTSYRDTLAVKIQCLEAGADAHMGWPVSWKYLELQVSNLIVNRKKVSEHFSRDRLIQSGCAGINPDGDFIKKIKGLITQHLPDHSLNVDLLARLLNMSRPTLYRKIKTITDLTPNELINQVRLQQAARLLEQGGYRVFEIAKMVGFHSQSSFGKAFIKQYKQTPRQYLQTTKVIMCA